MTPSKSSTWKVILHSRWLVVVSVLLPLVIWQAAATWGGLSAYLLPSPLQVLLRFGELLANGTLLYHSGWTLLEVLLGLALGSGLATVTGYALARSPLLERLLSPYLVASQAVPVVAIAPLLVIWFGPALFSKVLVCALTVFFPVLVNTAVGVRAVPQNLRDLMHALRASPVQVLRHLEIPAALPVLLGGLRIGATLSVIGAVVGEFVGADRGLGFLVNVGRGRYDTTLVFVAIFTLVGMALALYGGVVLVEKRLLRWEK
jgi:NitT/TauT family transport system permease protein